MKTKMDKSALLVSITALCTVLMVYGYFAKSSATNDNVIEIIPEPVPLSEGSPMFSLPVTEASGTAVKKNEKAEIDYSNTKDGYVMARFTGQTDKSTRMIIDGPSGEAYTYVLTSNGEYEVFPLSDGNGLYHITIYENISGTKYAAVVAVSADVMLQDEFAPFLRPNQYVNYTKNSETVKKAAELTQNSNGLTEKVEGIYQYVIDTISYDKELASTVQSGYVSDVDTILKVGKGICLDYAAVMSAMLRSQMIPTKLVVGYTGELYHAWINVYSEETGWVDGIIYFDGVNWKLMDPTFASGRTSKDEIKQYIGNGTNYTAKYLY